jgi:ferredoxin
MVEKKVELRFSRDLVEKPLISRVIGDFKVSVNILRANITPEEAGEMFVIMSGEKNALDRALKFLKSSGVEVEIEQALLSWDEELCVHCGACVTHCFRGAIETDPKTRLVSLSEKKCISCGICLPSCGYGALKLPLGREHAAKGGRP